MKDSKFFVACDSQEILDKIIDRYKGRIFHYPKRTFTGDRASVEGVQDAFIDLLLLSKNNILIASHISTFSEMAWWFGNCKADVNIILPKTYLYKKLTNQYYCLFWKWYNVS